MLEEYIKPPENFVASVRNGINFTVNKGPSPTEKGRLFLTWILTKVFHASEDDAENSILDGANDHGVDAILEIQGTEMNFFRIIQSKYGKSHSIDAIRAFKSKIDDLLKQKPNDLPQGRIRDILIQIKSKDWDVEAIYVTDQIIDFKNEDSF